ncbi:alternative oxidase [Trametes sanguinea]|nr:alternative oxidase [Trametes sanguinea]
MHAIPRRIITIGPRALLASASRPGLRTSTPPSSYVWRSFGTSYPRHASVVGSGTEGPHIQDAPQKATVPSPLKATDIKGDWVLFHPVYSPEELRSVQVLHRDAKTLPDKVAYGFVKLARQIFDIVSGYKHKPLPPDFDKLSPKEQKAYRMDESQWLQRILFLESIAAVPGMVAAALRHLRSLRLMRRDHGWIHTLLEEAENERMHLMTFMTLKNPSILFRAIILGAQGVFYNVFFMCYLVSPETCHRFVGYLEEEAVLTYGRCIKEIEAGRLPAWSNLPAPEIAKDYWRLGPDAKLLDVMYAVRSDESTHRFVNHSLASLKYGEDANPFALRDPGMTTKGSRIAFEREESLKYLHESQKPILEAKEAQRKTSE